MSAHSSLAEGASGKIAIIKADDLRGITENWDRFFSLSKEKGVKVSAGIICDSLQGSKPDYFEWLKALQASGSVEFWNHGWDHKRWTNSLISAPPSLTLDAHLNLVRSRKLPGTPDTQQSRKTRDTLNVGAQELSKIE